MAQPPDPPRREIDAREAAALGAAAAGVLESDVEKTVEAAIESDAVRQVINTRVDRAVRAALRRWVWRIVAAVVVVLVGSVGIVAYIGTSSTERLRTGALASCHRLQVLRDDVNRFEGTVYFFIVTARDARSATARSQSGTPADRVAAVAYSLIAASVRYVPPTDCARAVAHPETYRLPEPIPYEQAIKKGYVRVPQVLLDVQRAARETARGSH